MRFILFCSNFDYSLWINHCWPFILSILCESTSLEKNLTSNILIESIDFKIVTIFCFALHLCWAKTEWKTAPNEINSLHHPRGIFFFDKILSSSMWKKIINGEPSKVSILLTPMIQKHLNYINCLWSNKAETWCRLKIASFLVSRRF